VRTPGWDMARVNSQVWQRCQILLVKLALRASAKIRARTPVGMVDPTTGRYLPSMTQQAALRAQRAKAGVPSGRARGNWNLSIGAPDGSYDWERKDPSGTAQTMLHQRQALAIKPGDRVFICNGLPYIRRLEYGYSRQAPAGMVRVTAEELKPLVAELAAEVRAEGGTAGMTVLGADQPGEPTSPFFVGSQNPATGAEVRRTGLAGL
jgi:hypothetical protein